MDLTAEIHSLRLGPVRSALGDLSVRCNSGKEALGFFRVSGRLGGWGDPRALCALPRRRLAAVAAFAR